MSDPFREPGVWLQARLVIIMLVTGSNFLQVFTFAHCDVVGFTAARRLSTQVSNRNAPVGTRRGGREATQGTEVRHVHCLPGFHFAGCDAVRSCHRQCEGPAHRHGEKSGSCSTRFSRFLRIGMEKVWQLQHQISRCCADIFTVSAREVCLRELPCCSWRLAEAYGPNKDAMKLSCRTTLCARDVTQLKSNQRKRHR